jgi:hypothetical protein
MTATKMMTTPIISMVIIDAMVELSYNYLLLPSVVFCTLLV